MAVRGAVGERIAAGRPRIRRPAAFADHIDESKWVSFTTTLHDPTFFQLVRDLTGNVPARGGSSLSRNRAGWPRSSLPHQPHFIGQPDGRSGLLGLWPCSSISRRLREEADVRLHGREIMTEIIGHLRIEAQAATILETSTCIPCMMPFITSQFLRREKGDRPQVVPNTRRTSPSSGNSANCRTTWCSPWNIRSARRKRPCTHCLG
jgi:oleate hydratase